MISGRTAMEKTETVNEFQQAEWRTLIKESITRADELAKHLNINVEDVKEIIKTYPMRINKYFLSLIESENDAIWKQCVPDIRELNDAVGVADPLFEEKDSPVEGLTHRYPDRVLLLVSNDCANYCRFCTRKRRVGRPFRKITREQIADCVSYIREHSEIRDVLVSGGDPLMLEDSEIEHILKELRSIEHVEIIRIGTRIPCTLPQRITQELCAMLRRYHPLYINVHFNHPKEITPESKRALEMLANAGIPLGNQSVLLRGVNDKPEIIKELNLKLLKMRVKPYYIYQCDLVRGTEHFRTNIEKGAKIIESLRGFTSGLAVPQFVIDAPCGGGKIPISPNYIGKRTKKGIIMRDYENKLFSYPEPETET